MPLPEITMRWEHPPHDGGSSSWWGYVGTLRTKVATVGYGLFRKRDAPWVLNVALPGFDQPRECASVEEAQALAERIVASFVAKALATPESTS